jgi:hypothetical protein
MIWKHAAYFGEPRRLSRQAAASPSFFRWTKKKQNPSPASQGTAGFIVAVMVRGATWSPQMTWLVVKKAWVFACDAFFERFAQKKTKKW